MAGVEEEFAVAVSTGDLAVEPVKDGEIMFGAAGRELVAHRRIKRHIGNDAAFADMRQAKLELRLEEGKDVAAPDQQRPAATGAPSAGGVPCGHEMRSCS